MTTTAGGKHTTATHPSTAALARCFDEHGFQASVGSGGGGNNLTYAGVVISGNVDPNSAQFQAAAQACHKYLPGGGPPAISPAEQAEGVKGEVKFAACMRQHGVPGFPDPNGQGIFPADGIRKLDLNSPLLLTAFKACKSLESNVGPSIEFGPGGEVGQRA
jgi:hypothetical protein